MPTSALYRVEHHVGRTVTVLAEAVVGFPHSTTLVPYVSRLVLQGASGWLVLVEETTGRRVARRHIRRPGRQRWTRSPQLRHDARPDGIGLL